MMNDGSSEATKAMYAAAEKAGMASELRRVEAEVHVSGVHAPTSMYAGKNFASVQWNLELCERETFVRPDAAVMARAEKWLAVYGAKQGWTVVPRY